MQTIDPNDPNAGEKLRANQKMLDEILDELSNAENELFKNHNPEPIKLIREKLKQLKEGNQYQANLAPTKNNAQDQKFNSNIIASKQRHSYKKEFFKNHNPEPLKLIREKRKRLNEGSQYQVNLAPTKNNAEDQEKNDAQDQKFNSNIIKSKQRHSYKKEIAAAFVGLALGAVTVGLYLSNVIDSKLTMALGCISAILLTAGAAIFSVFKYSSAEEIGPNKSKTAISEK